MNKRTWIIVAIVIVGLFVVIMGDKTEPSSSTSMNTVSNATSYNTSTTSTLISTTPTSSRAKERESESAYSYINTISVDSTALSEIGYDLNNQILFVRFKDSGVAYIYEGVPSSVWSDFKNTSSYGSYYNKAIKGQYDCVRLE